MKKRFSVWPILLIPLAVACMGGPYQGTPARQASYQLYVLDNYTSAGQAPGTQHIVALPVGTANQVARLTLPAGLTDLSHQQLYIASPVENDHTTISVFDTRSGATVRTFRLAGIYSTADQGYADSMLSGNGRWLALREQNTSAGNTNIALVDTQAGTLVKSIHLNGNFTLDAVSPKGTMLYLLEYTQAGTSHYNVRAYNIQTNQLVPGSIVDKTAIEEKMQGAALTRQMSTDGDMAYTLYINVATNKAFIHILWLTNTIDSRIPFPFIARCIDLPVGNSPALLRYYTLTLSRDGQILYAANAALGLLATVNLDISPNNYQPWLIPSAKTAHFNPNQGGVTASDQARELYKAAVLSLDQRLLYIAGLHGIWVIDTTTLQVRNEYLKQQSFTGLTISPDGQTLYAVDPTTGITLLNPTGGATRAVIQGAIRAPWGIDWTDSST